MRHHRSFALAAGLESAALGLSRIYEANTDIEQLKAELKAQIDAGGLVLIAYA
jgi:hypothetical protein